MSSRISFEPTEDGGRQGSMDPLHRNSSFASVNFEERQVYEAWLDSHPCLLQNFDQLEAAAAGKLITVFLDYDGTLTPIVNNPDAAFLSEHVREAVRRVARLFPTAIISGRGREKVEQFVQIKELFYAGSHGMDIAGPKVMPINIDGSSDDGMATFQPAAQYEPMMKQLGEELWTAIGSIHGATVENNKFCVSVHFRNCAAGDYSAVMAAVEEVTAHYQELHITRGRKVLEVRPKMDWNKGSALLHLLRMLGLEEREVYCLYIGDDRTDEDAFQVLSETGTGSGILVTTKRKDTAGRWTLKDPSEVAAFLYRLVAWGHTSSNRWHQKGSCNGWHLIAGETSSTPRAEDCAVVSGIDGGGGSGEVQSGLTPTTGAEKEKQQQQQQQGKLRSSEKPPLPPSRTNGTAGMEF